MPRTTYTAQLLQKTCISESAQCYHLQFAIPELDTFPLAAGQFISAVAPDPNGKIQTRAYSLASAPNANLFDLCVNRVEGGFFSNYLCDLTEGDSVQVHGPHGHFVLKQPITDSIFVATGTGIAPMRGFTQSLFPQSGPDAGADFSQGKHIWLVYGTRRESELYYRDYFEQLAAQHPNFHYVATLSRASEEWSGLRGYVQEHLAPIVENHPTYVPVAPPQPPTPASGDTPATIAATVAALQTTLVAEAGAAAIPPLVLPSFEIYTYICGLNNMVSAVREKLASYGWHKKQIIFERYD